MSWITSLRYRDLLRLRQAVYRVHFKHIPGEPFDSREADKIIEAIGPRVAETMIQRMIEGDPKGMHT